VAAAVTVDSLAAVTKTNDNIITVKSKGYEDVSVDVTDLEIKPEEKGRSHSLVRGVVKGFRDRGYAVGGFTATTTSDVFKGAGMSSSASFEVLISQILNEFYNHCLIRPVERAIISQYAENVYFGKPSGLMDQSAIALGGISFIDFKDEKFPVVKKLDFKFDGVSAVVINCGGDHSDLTKCYAEIKSDMEAVARFFGEKKLRSVDEKAFYSSFKQLYEATGGRAVLRAKHFFDEDARVLALVKAVKRADEAGFMKIINASGRSSSEYLKNLYPEGDGKMPVPFGLAAVEKMGVLASRVHGGGFAGTILVFVKTADLKNFVNKANKIFGKENVYAVGIRKEGAAKILDINI